MKSINVKRIAAVATGLGMVASAFSVGLAGFQTSGNVTKLVDDIKANLGDTQVVVGTNAALSDGIAAAKIAATLASLNFVAGGATTGGKSVKLETGAGSVATSTSDDYKIEFTGTGQNTTFSTTVANNTITYSQLSKLLSVKSVKPTINSSASTITYEDQIRVYQGQPKYSESASSTGTTEHGLYLALPASGTKGQRGLTYELKFSGSGLPISAANVYQNLPVVKMHGNDISIDTTNTINGKLVLSTGAKYTVVNGDSVTQGNFTVTVKSIGATTSSSGTQYAVSFEVKNAAGTVETASVNSGSSGSFFAEDVSITVESVVGNTAVVRVGTGKTSFTEGATWTIGGGTTATSKWVLDAVTASTTYLSNITLRYGNPSNTAMKYNFDGTYTNGLKAGTTIDGPLTSAGAPYFQLQLVGFGSKSTAVDTTTVTFEASGDDTDPSAKVIKTSWVARDGTVNTWAPTGANVVTFGDGNMTPGSSEAGGPSGNILKFNGSASFAKKWTIINDKVVYFESALARSGTTDNRYDVIFKVGGENGAETTVPNVNDTQSGFLTYGLGGPHPIKCNVTAHGTNDIKLSIPSGFSGPTYSSYDNLTETCDIYPNVVPFGKNTEIVATPSASTPAPSLNLLASVGNRTTVADATSGVNDSTATSRPWAWIGVNETTVLNTTGANTPFFIVVYDSDASGGSQKGIGAYRLYNYSSQWMNDSWVNISNATTLINMAQTSIYESSKYEITSVGTELTADTSNKLTLVMPEQQRNVLVQIAGTVAPSNATTGTTTAVVGDTVGSVKIVDILCPAGAFEKVSASLLPQNLVKLDSAASATYQIAVGGPWANTVAAAMAEDVRALVTGAAGDYAIAADGNKLLVAGYIASDTMSAADKLISDFLS